VYRNLAKSVLSLAGRVESLFGGKSFGSNGSVISDPGKTKNILLWSMDRMGDVIRSTPAIRAIKSRFSSARITAVFAARAAPILLENPWIDEHCPVRSPFDIREQMRVIRRMRRQSWDLGVLLEADPHWAILGAFLLRAIGVKQIARFDFGHGISRSTLGVRLTEQGSWIDQFNRLVTAVGASADGTRTEVHLHSSERNDADRILQLFDVAPGQSFILIHPGGNFLTVSRQWPPRAFAELIDKVRGRWSIPIAVSGLPAERKFIEEIRRQTSVPLVDLCGRLNMRQLAAVIERSAMCIMNDTGPLHIAHALSRPTVAILGPTAPEVVGIPPTTIVVRADLPCSPCAFLAGWKACTNPVRWECLSSVSAEQVFRAVSVHMDRAAVPIKCDKA